MHRVRPIAKQYRPRPTSSPKIPATCDTKPKQSPICTAQSTASFQTRSRGILCRKITDFVCSSVSYADILLVLPLDQRRLLMIAVFKVHIKSHSSRETAKAKQSPRVWDRGLQYIQVFRLVEYLQYFHCAQASHLTTTYWYSTRPRMTIENKEIPDIYQPWYGEDYFKGSLTLIKK